MNFREEMIVIDGKVVTSNIAYCKYNSKYGTYGVKFKNSNQFFNYSLRRLYILRDPICLDTNIYSIYINGMLTEDIAEIYRFNYKFNKFFYHIIFKNGLQKSYDNSEVKVEKALYNQNTNNSIFSYLKEIANAVSVKTNEGLNLLDEQYKKITMVDLNKALGGYLSPENFSLKRVNKEVYIFPFGCNSSQFQAVKNAIENRISVIEGPPGTGKTQTILNIIANLLIRNQTCQIVSNNNSAIENVEEKLKKYDLDFFVALLGSNINKENFIDNQKSIPDLSKYAKNDLYTLKRNINQLESLVQKIYGYESRVATLKQELYSLELQQKHFDSYLKENNIETYKLKYDNGDNLVKIWTELSSNEVNKISFWKKLYYIIFKGVGSFTFYKKDIKVIINSIQKEMYSYSIKECKNEIREKELYLKNNKFYLEQYIDYSMLFFKRSLYDRFNGSRKDYKKYEIKRKYTEFLSDYPVILSTTYSSRNSFNKDVKFDYIIMDEASQIDVATGALSLSSGTNAIIIGDEKQLPNVVPEHQKKLVDSIFEKYNIDEAYSFSKNSFLSSIKKLFENVPVTLLKEHYRCHPKIINFCNQKFYDNELVIMTKDNNEENVIKVIRTNEGNHTREHTNQRQIDVIKELLPKIKTKDIGVIAPYNNQVDTIKKEIPSLEVNTIHKFQGREKDVIIISTVDDTISDFVDDPNILNVAISRAKNQLFIIVTGNDIKNTNINDFIEYVSYNNMEIENNKIYSIFDFLYESYTEERIKYLKEHKNVSEYDSENLMYGLISDILENYDNLSVICHHPLYLLIKDKSLMTIEESKYANNYLTHLDFIIYNTLTKKPVLVVEVDGYNYHKEGTVQSNRDKLKDSILEKYNIPLLRFKTNGSGEKEIIIEKLNTLLCINKDKNMED